MAYSPSAQSSRETKTGVLVLGVLATLFVGVATYRYFQTTRSKATANSAAATDTTKQRLEKERGDNATSARFATAPEPEQPRRLPPMEDHVGLIPQPNTAPMPHSSHGLTTRPLEKHAAPPSTVQRTSHTQPVHAYPPINRTPAPAPRQAPQQIVAGRNDSFWSIAERAYGAGSYYKALYAYNRSNFPQPDRLEAGAIVITPPVEKLHQLFPADCPQDGRLKSATTPASDPGNVQLASHKEATVQRLYNVQPGEDLFGIATRELGAGHRWTEIYRLNADILGGAIERVPVGLRLRMPPR